MKKSNRELGLNDKTATGRVAWVKQRYFVQSTRSQNSTSALSYPSSNNWEVILLSFPKSFQDLRKDGSFAIIAFNFILFLSLGDYNN